MKKIKKVVSFILILTLIGANFIPLLNVKAEGITIITNDSTCNSKGCLVTNTTTLGIENFNSSGTESDEFSAYKVLDTYYNKDTNEISYAFTSDFVNFKNDSNYSNYVVSDGITIGNLTIDDYFNLTSDSAGYSGVRSSSTLNKLVSKYASYIRNSGASVLSIPLTREVENSDRASAQVSVGSYLILPHKLVIEEYLDSDIGNNLLIKSGKIYGAMVGNAVIKEENGIWSLDSVYVYSKESSNRIESSIYNLSLEEILSDSEEIWDNLVLDQNMVFQANKKYTFVVIEARFSEIPTNAINKEQKMEITIPTGIDFKMFREGDGLLEELKGGEVLDSDGSLLYNVSISNNKVVVIPNLDYSKTIYMDFGFELNLKQDVGSDDIVVGDLGNEIKTTLTYPADPYKEPGTEGASKTLDLTNTIYTYGLELENSKKNDSDTLLKGAEYSIYSSNNIEDKNFVGSFTVGENGKGSFIGLATGTYYIKQTKAPAGYKLQNELQEVKIGSEGVASENEGFYKAVSENEPLGFLPSTGGIGTVIYTFIGLLIITVGSIAFISYKKKKEVQS